MTPEQLWIALAAVGGFMASQVWPTLRDLWKARAERETLEAKSDADRVTEALEASSRAQQTTAGALEKIAQALDLMARDQVAKTFQIEELRRSHRDLMAALQGAGVVPARRVTDEPQALAALLREEPRP